MYMKHLVANLYTAAKLTALLPLTSNRDSVQEYRELKIPMSWEASVCRICVSQYSAQVGSTVAIYREFVADITEEYTKRGMSIPRCLQIRQGKATIGATVMIEGKDLVVIWRGERANLELGTCVAEITLDRSKAQIVRTRVLTNAERYFVTGSGRIREFTEGEIAELHKATIAAHKVASGETLFASSAKPEPAPLQRREVTRALLSLPGEVQEDGSIEVSPLDWQDHKAAEHFNVDSRLIRQLREELAICVVSHDVALNDAANALEMALAAPSESDVRGAARTLLNLVHL